MSKKKIIGIAVGAVAVLGLGIMFLGGDSDSPSQDSTPAVAEEKGDTRSANNDGGASQGEQNGGMKMKSSGKVVSRADGSVFVMGSCRVAAPSADAPRYSASLKASELPPKVDLRKFMPPVEDQGQVGSCTANATAGAYEYLLRRNQGVDDYDISRLFLYYNARVMENCADRDSGAIIGDVFKSLNQQGVCSEETWPYIESKFKDKPSQEAYEEATKNKISKYECVGRDLNAWKSALAEGYPIVFGVQTFPSFQNPRNGHISMPGRNEQNTGGHAMCCVGYSDPDRVFIVRNSWGHQWGDGGYCYIPYDYIMSPQYNCGDCWVMYDVNPIRQEDAEEAWDDSTESIFVDMENEFSDMSDEDWLAMCDELGDYDIVYRLGALYNIACWGDEEVSPEESKVALDKLKKILIMFGLEYSPKKVMKHCENIWVNESDDFFDITVAILSKYLSEGARATIAADMLEICSADDDAADDERDIILGLVGDWLNDDLILAYYADYLDEDDYDDYDYYDDEDDYYYDDDYEYDFDYDYYYDDDDDYSYVGYDYDDDDDYDYDYY